MSFDYNITGDSCHTNGHEDGFDANNVGHRMYIYVNENGALVREG